MARPNPRDVFDDPTSHWAFLTKPSDDEVEGQHFDRKEAGQVQSNGRISNTGLRNLRELVAKTVSAFANSNREGGLLVLGLSSTGLLTGIDHLTEDEQNSVTNLHALVVAHAGEVRIHQCTDSNGQHKDVCLIYSGWSTTGICETPGSFPKAWTRNGSQSVPVTDSVRESLRVQKGLVHPENDPFCEYLPEDVDKDVLNEFRQHFMPGALSDFDDARLLKEAGAIVQKNGDWWFTVPGVLFFGLNPQRLLSHAYVRLLRFDVPSSDFTSRGTPTFSKEFRGPVTRQIREARSYFRDSGFFDRFEKRKPDGGFIEEPELPPIAIDEAIVNAVVHRDYRANIPIECEAYQDAFFVKNAGRVIQRSVDLPDRFRLDTTHLDSTPRNSKLLEWLKVMKDSDGRAFVQAVSEGTKVMTREMEGLKLPAPSFRLTDTWSLLKLQSNAEDRKAAIRAAAQAPATETLNHYPLQIRQGADPVPAPEFRGKRGEFIGRVRDALETHDWFIDHSSFSRLTVHRKGNELPLSPAEVTKYVRLYPAYSIQHVESFGTHGLSIDYRCEVRNVARLNRVLAALSVDDVLNRTCMANDSGWRKGRIISIDDDWTRVFFFDTETEGAVATSEVIPNLPLRLIERLLKLLGVKVDLQTHIKRASLASEKAAARIRSEKIQHFVDTVAGKVFPVAFGEYEASLVNTPLSLKERGHKGSSLSIRRLNEPQVLFRDRNSSPDVREGITKFGSFDSDAHTIEIVPICLDSYKSKMEGLINRLIQGKFKYRGSERTFSTRFSYRSIHINASAQDFDGEISRLLRQNDDWIGDKELRRVFLVQCPEAGFSSDDETSPYYVTKRRLLEAGIPCQMIDSPTLNNPDWKDLNLALNITAKCGITPWVLPERVPDADFFIGLSYTQSKDGRRIMGFANVFNSYGRWAFYTGNTSTFEIADRAEHLSTLARETLVRLKNDHTLPTSPSLVIHHSVRIGRDDRTAILSAVRSVAPDASLTFVWVNSHSNSRMFDTRPETDGSVRRGSYVSLSRQRVLLSTTGSNPYRKAMGTPRPLELTALHFDPKKGDPSDYDQRSLALQVLSLTKLNWASTDAFCGEPITVKYASNIAYLTAAFLRQKEPFTLHKTLESTPWFI